MLPVLFFLKGEKPSGQTFARKYPGVPLPAPVERPVE